MHVVKIKIVLLTKDKEIGANTAGEKAFFKSNKIELNLKMQIFFQIYEMFEYGHEAGSCARRKTEGSQAQVCPLPSIIRWKSWNTNKIKFQRFI